MVLSRASAATASAAKAEPALKPNQPNQKDRAQKYERNVMGTIRHHAEAAALPKKNGKNQTGKARGDMNDVSAGEIKGADLIADKTAVSAPDHMGKRRINHHRPYSYKGDHRGEFHTSRKRTGDDGCSYGCKSKLKRHIHYARIRCIFQRRVGHSLGQGARTHQLVEPSEKRRRPVTSVGKRPTEHDPQNADDSDDRERHNHGVHHVFTT